MPDPTQHIRSIRALAAIALASGLLALPTGCETFPIEEQPEPVVRSTEPASAVVPKLPGQYSRRCGCCIFHHDFPIDDNDPLFREPEVLPDHVYGELRLPHGNAIVQVYLFDTEERYERYMFDPKYGRYKGQPTRRAYFFVEPRIGGADELKIYTWMGDHLRTDLRHELTHALLNGVMENVPLWLDEGLAGYFELPQADGGVNPQHVETLRRGPFEPNLGRLEQLTQVADMQKPEYREAWLWVHFMLRGNPAARKVLLAYLQELRTNPDPEPLLPRLRQAVPDLEFALHNHLAAIDFPTANR